MKLTEQQNQEIAEQKAQKFETKRVTSSELEKILYDAIPILDHGFVDDSYFYHFYTNVAVEIGRAHV